MENVKRLAGLILLTCISIALEMYIPRIDTLIVIVLLLLENREYKTLVCMLPLILLIQEGMGTQHFGASILFLAAVFCLGTSIRLPPFSSSRSCRSGWASRASA